MVQYTRLSRMTKLRTMATRHENGDDGDNANTNGNKGKTQIKMGPQGHHNSKSEVCGCSSYPLPNLNPHMDDLLGYEHSCQTPGIRSTDISLPILLTYIFLLLDFGESRLTDSVYLT